MRLKVKRRRLSVLLIKLLIIFSVIFTVYIFVRIKPDSSSSTPVKEVHPTIFVTESENKAIPIWLNLSRHYRLRLGSGTLININSHFNDGFTIRHGQSYHKSTNMDDLLTSLSSVDLQMVSSAVAGQFSNVFWIYPIWSSGNGIFSKRVHHIGRREDDVCLCSYSGNVADSNDTRCYVLYPSIPKDIALFDCDLLDIKWNMIFVQDIYAVEGLNASAISYPIVVNLNLDFFTVDLPSELYISKNRIDDINKFLNSTFCITTERDKTIVDSWFRIIVNSSILMPVTPLDDHFRSISRLLCRQPKQVSSTIENFVKIINALTLSIRKELVTTGICITDNMMSDGYNGNRHRYLYLCASKLFSTIGLNYPVLSHYGIDQEFHLQVGKLSNFFKKYIKQPLVISIARSSKIGFVSEKNQRFLEKLILDELKSIYHLTSSDILYDDLLKVPS